MRALLVVLAACGHRALPVAEPAAPPPLFEGSTDHGGAVLQAEAALLRGDAALAADLLLSLRGRTVHADVPADRRVYVEGLLASVGDAGAAVLQPLAAAEVADALGWCGLCHAAAGVAGRTVAADLPAAVAEPVARHPRLADATVGALLWPRGGDFDALMEVGDLVRALGDAPPPRAELALGEADRADPVRALAPWLPDLDDALWAPGSVHDRVEVHVAVHTACVQCHGSDDGSADGAP